MKYHCLLILTLGCFLTERMPVLGQNSQDLSVSLEPHKRVLILGEPLFVTARIKNNGQQPTVLAYANGPSYALGQGLGRVLIAKENEQLHSWSDRLRPIEKVSPVKLSAGQEIINEYVILYSHPTGFAFPITGNYRVSVEYVLKSGESVQAKPILITVREPTGEDARVWETLRKESGYGILLQTPWDPRVDSSVLSKLTIVHDQDGRSVYKQYLGLAIGRNYKAGNNDNRKKAVAFLQSVLIDADAEGIREKTLRELQGYKGREISTSDK